MTFRPSSIRVSRSVLLSLALGASSLGAVACGGGSSPSSASSAPSASAVTLAGTYAADASDASAPYASLTFLKSGAFFGYRQGCAASAAGCRVTGTYSLDNVRGTLSLKVDGGAVQTLAVGSVTTSASASSATSAAPSASSSGSSSSSGGSLISKSRATSFGVSINDGDDDGDDAGTGELVTDDNNADLYIPQQGDPSNTGGAVGPANGGTMTSSDDTNDTSSAGNASTGAGTDGGSSAGLVSAAGPLVYPIATGLTLQDAAYHQVQDADGDASLYCASPDTASLDCGAQDATEVASDSSADDGANGDDDGDSSLSSLAPLRGKIRHADGAKSSCSCAKNRTYNLQVTAKAFIASLGTDVGNPGDPYYKVPFLAAAVATAAYYHEAPSEMAGCASGPPATFDTCRLKATTNLIATCAGTRLVSLTSSMTDEEGGDEGPFFHGAVAKAFAKASVQSSNGHSSGSFGLLVYGHPPLSLEPGFQVVKTRPQVDIWNHTTGNVQCTANGISVTVASGGSKFPSMASWVSRVDGGRHDVLSFHTRVQGNFGDLWNLEPVPTAP